MIQTMIAIRQACPEDATALLGLIVEALEEDRIRHGLGYPVPSLEWLQTSLGFRQSRFQGGFGLVGVIDSQIIGFAFYSWVWRTYAPAIYIDDLFVKPDYRNLGFGKQLLRAALQLAKSAGARQAYQNVDAQRLYKAEGAKPIEEVETSFAYMWSL
jgi:GNAT superfamily N-acetyltransferase